MRRMSVLFGVALAAIVCLADPSRAQPASRPSSAGQSGGAARPPALRGAINPPATQPLQFPPTRGGGPPLETPALPPMPPPLGPDGGQCRLDCAQSYYFCLGGDASEECSSAWGQCRAGCTAPRAPAPVWTSPIPSAARLPTP